MPEKQAELEEKILAIIAKEGNIPPEKVSREATLLDLDIQSVDMVMILQGIEEAFDLYVPMDETMHSLKNVGDVVDAISLLLNTKKVVNQ